MVEKDQEAVAKALSLTSGNYKVKTEDLISNTEYSKQPVLMVDKAGVKKALEKRTQALGLYAAMATNQVRKEKEKSLDFTISIFHLLTCFNLTF